MRVYFIKIHVWRACKYVYADKSRITLPFCLESFPLKQLLSTDLGHINALILLKGQLMVVCRALPCCMHQLCVLYSLKKYEKNHFCALIIKCAYGGPSIIWISGWLGQFWASYSPLSPTDIVITIHSNDTERPEKPTCTYGLRKVKPHKINRWKKDLRRNRPGN